MPDLEEVHRKREHLFHVKKLRAVRLHVHEPDQSFLEAVLSRGDRRLGPVLLRAHRLGCRFDAWDDRFRKDLWDRAFAEVGVDPYSVSHRERGLDEVLPWDHVDAGIAKRYLRLEWERALRERETSHCFDDHCNACGINTALCYPIWRNGRPGLGTEPCVVAQPEPIADTA
jgi:hypothetical protein